MKETQMYDALVIGGGPAGLSAALSLARQTHTVALFDVGQGVNHTDKIHNVLTWDSKSRSDFIEAARVNINENYDTVEVIRSQVESLQKTAADTFTARSAANATVWEGKKLILATGVECIWPEIDGYKECYAKGIFHCLYCHGPAEVCLSSGILAVDDVKTPALAMHFARSALKASKKVTIYTNGVDELFEGVRSLVENSPQFAVDNKSIAGVKMLGSGSQVTLLFADGTSTVEGFLAHKPQHRLKGPFAKSLNLKLSPSGDIETSPPFFQTSLRGVFAAGDAASPIKVVTNAIFAGSCAGVGAATQVQADDCNQTGFV